MKINLKTMKEIKKILIILIVISLHACKKDNKEINKQVESNNVAEPIDTSYKKNIRLFDNFYYGMPMSEVLQVNAALDKKNDSDHAILNYNNEDIYCKKEFKYKNGLLEEVTLIALEKTAGRENSPLLLSLFNTKYGKSKINEDKEETDEEQTIVTKILNYEKSILTATESDDLIYNPKIHKEVSENEFKNKLDVFHQITNTKLHTVSIGSSHYKMLKDITKDEIIFIPIKAAIKKIKYKKTVTYVNNIWEKEGKKIVLHYLKSISCIGNKYEPLHFGVNYDINLTFSKVKKNSEIKNSEIRDSKVAQKQTLDAI